MRLIRSLSFRSVGDGRRSVRVICPDRGDHGRTANLAGLWSSHRSLRQAISGRPASGLRDDGYFWVPGTGSSHRPWECFGTPGYWGWNNGAYAWNAGYWGPHVRNYGGINYGYAMLARVTPAGSGGAARSPITAPLTISAGLRFQILTTRP